MYLLQQTEDWSGFSVLPRDRQFPHDHPICSPIFSAGGVGFWVLTTLSLPFSTTKKSHVSLLRWTACNSSSTPWDIEIQQRPKFGTVWSLESPRSRGELKLIAKGHSDSWASWAMMIIDFYNDYWCNIDANISLTFAFLLQGFCSFFLYCPGGPRRQNGSKTGIHQAGREELRWLRCEHQMQPERRQPKTRCGHLSKRLWGFHSAIVWSINSIENEKYNII